MEIIRKEVAEIKPVIVCLTETHLNETYTDAAIQLQNYVVYRCDRIGHKGGGVVVYVRSDIRSNSVVLSTTLEHVCVIVSLNGEELAVLCVYKPPENDKDNSLITESDLILTIELCHHKFKNYILVGDFNYPQLKWHLNQLDPPNESPARKFLDLMDKLLLEQLVMFPTRVRNESVSSLDLIVVPNSNIVFDIESRAPWGKSDHVVIHCQLIGAAPSRDSKPYLNYGKGRFDELRKILEKIEWGYLYDMTVEGAWESFKSKILQAVHKTIPTCKQDSKQSVLWTSNKLTKVSSRKKISWAKFKRGQGSWFTYKKHRNQEEKLRRQCRIQYEIKVAEAAKSNPKAFYKYCNKNKKTATTIPMLKKQDGALTTSLEEVSQVLANHFEKVCVNEVDPSLKESVLIESENIILVTKDEVERMLVRLDATKSAGPDNIHPRVLKECSGQLAYPLSIIFQRSLNWCTIPKDWKKANISCLHKGGSKSDPNNYRPISLTSVCCKMLEKIVRFNILRTCAFSKHQHGFLPRRSCFTNLLEFYEYVTTEWDEGNVVDCVYLDFSKAFDRLHLKRLIWKLTEKWKLEETIVKWVADFLTDRSLVVVANGIMSKPVTLKSGTPQGSVLGPLLYLLYVDDLSEQLTSPFKQFADDTKLYRARKATEDMEMLQEDINKLHKWNLANFTEINIKKSFVVSFQKSEEPTPDYLYNNQVLPKSQCERDLGVYINSNLGLSVQVDRAVQRGRAACIQIGRTFKYLNESVLRQLIVTFVRPHLEFCNSIWNPMLQKDKVKIERVQRFGTSLLKRIGHLPYTERLERLRLISLEDRRKRGDLIETFKLIHGQYDVSWDSFLNVRTNECVRNKPMLKSKKINKTRERQHFFTQRVVGAWNELPQSVKAVDPEKNLINNFKNKLDKHYNWSFDKNTVPNLLTQSD